MHVEYLVNLAQFSHHQGVRLLRWPEILHGRGHWLRLNLRVALLLPEQWSNGLRQALGCLLLGGLDGHGESGVLPLHLLGVHEPSEVHTVVLEVVLHL